MALSKQDKDYIESIIHTHNENINLKFQLIEQKLTSIEQQTIKTNGRVTKLESQVQDLEKKEIQHTINCPVAAKVKALEDQQTFKKGQYKAIAIIATVAATTAGIIISIINILI